MTVRVTIQDDRLAGARHAVIVSATRVAVAAAAGRRIAMVDTLVAEVVGDSGDLGLIPGHLVLCGGKLWTITTDGQLIALTTADSPVASDPVALTAYDPLWLTSVGSIVIAPCGQAGVATINSSSRAVIAIHDGVLARIAFAVASSGGYLYAFDGAGGGAVLTVSSAGVLTLVTRFLAMDVVGPVHAFIDGTTLVVACERRQAVIELSLADPTDPVRSTVTRYPGYTLRSVLDNGAHSPLTDEPYALFDLAEWFPVRHGLMLASGKPFLIHEAAGRATLFELVAPVSAGEDQSIHILGGTLVGTTTLTPSPTYLWAQVSGPAGVTFGTPTALTSTFTLPGFGTYVLSLTVTTGATVTVDYITVISTNLAPIVNAGVDQAISLLSGSLLATASDPNSLPSALTYQWAKVSGPGTVTFGTGTALASTYTLSAFGTYVLSFTASDGLDATSDTLTIVSTNTAPVVNAGADQAINILTGSVTGTASDANALPSPLTYLWSKLSGTGTVTFGTATALTTTFTLPALGTFVLRLSVTDGLATTTDDLQIVASNTTPVVNAGMDQSSNALSGSLLGVVTDPDVGQTFTYTWSKVSGPSTLTFGTGSALATTFTLGASGTYVARLTVSDGFATVADDVTLFANAAPTCNAGIDQSIGTLVATLLGTASDSDSAPNALTYAWSKVSGTGTVTFSAPAALSTTATFPGDDTYVLRLTVSDGLATATDDIQIVVASVNSRAVIAGGWLMAGATTFFTRMDYFQIDTAANAADFGAVGANAAGADGCGNTTQGVVHLGHTATGTWSANVRIIAYATLADAASGNSLDASHAYRAVHSSATRAVFMGGENTSGVSVTSISYIALPISGAGSSFGTLTTARQSSDGAGSTTRMVVIGGATSGSSCTTSIEYVTIASTGNGSSFGTLATAHGVGGATSSATIMIQASGFSPNSTSTAFNVITCLFVTIATTGNGANFADLTLARYRAVGVSNKTRGAFAGGVAYATSGLTVSTIDYHIFATAATATSFGNLTGNRQASAGMAAGHGGL